ncbi:TPA: phosphoribosylamine--glycine ligase [bacterium]|nr:phosphoribosylamine--glycine ligase [bacterium]
MKVMVVGFGGREHTLCWKLSQSSKIKRLYAAPGNAGTEAIAQNVEIEPAWAYIPSLGDFAASEGIDLTVVGPEAPLAEGIVDHFNQRGLRIFGPDKKAAQLESSKVFAKEFMTVQGIPTARYKVFDGYQAALGYLEEVEMPVVIKADGLAQGKGVFVCQEKEEAREALKKTLVERCFGQAGCRVIIEECLMGEEASFLAFTDGKTFISMASSQDHKRVYDGDRGPNTGGMGAYSPAPIVTQEIQDRIEEEILGPTIEGLSTRDCRFTGVIYLGLMITEDGPKLLEYNVRFGDPETQVILPRLKTDLLLVLEACLEGRLSEIDLEWDKRATICVVLASGGYPGDYEKGKEVWGLDKVAQSKDVIVFHAGTIQRDDQILTNGGRVLGITAYGHRLGEAAIRAYEAIEKINFEGCHFRKDIGYKALNRGVR